MMTSRADAQSRQSGPIVIHANWYEFRAGEVFENELVVSRTLLWSVRGRGTLIIDGTELTLDAGSFVLTPWRHRIRYVADQAAPLMVGSIHLVPDLVMGDVDFRAAHGVTDPLAADPRRRDVPDLFGGARFVAGAFMHARRLEALASYVVWRFVETPHVEHEMRTLAALLIDEIAAAVGARSAAEAQPSEDLRLMQQGVQAGLTGRLHLADVAAFAGVSASTAERLFTRHTGVSVARWVVRARVERAQYLLQSTNLPIGAIARATGFKDQYHFSRTFRRSTGSSPTEYRTRYRVL